MRFWGNPNRVKQKSLKFFPILGSVTFSSDVLNFSMFMQEYHLKYYLPQYKNPDVMVKNQLFKQNQMCEIRCLFFNKANKKLLGAKSGLYAGRHIQLSYLSRRRIISPIQFASLLSSKTFSKQMVICRSNMSVRKVIPFLFESTFWRH